MKLNEFIADATIPEGSTESMADLLRRALPGFEKFLAMVKNAVIKVGNFLLGLVENAHRMFKRIENGFHDRAILPVYRGRHKWKKGDVKNLRSYTLNASAQRRLERLYGSKTAGRPKVKPYVDSLTRLIEWSSTRKKIYAPDTPRHERLALLKKTAGWSCYIAMLYKSKYCSNSHIGDRSKTTEGDVGALVNISSAQVHRLRYQPDCSLYFQKTELTFSDFENFLRTGWLPPIIQNAIFCLTLCMLQKQAVRCSS